jgi:hypothetical protein
LNAVIPGGCGSAFPVFCGGLGFAVDEVQFGKFIQCIDLPELAPYPITNRNCLVQIDDCLAAIALSADRAELDKAVHLTESIPEFMIECSGIFEVTGRLPIMLSPRLLLRPCEVGMCVRHS